MREKLCAKCSAIDLDAIFGGGMASLASGPVSVCFLDHVRSGSACSLCKFFMEMEPAGRLNRLAGYAFVAAAASKVFRIPFRGFVDVPVLAVHRVGDRGYPTKRLIMKLAAGDPNSISVRKVASMVEWDRVREWNSFCKAHHRNVCVSETSFAAAGSEGDRLQDPENHQDPESVDRICCLELRLGRW